MADEREAAVQVEPIDMGHLIGLWEVTRLPEGEAVFDLNLIEPVGIGKFGAAEEDMDGTLELRAERLPQRAYVGIFFPKEALPDGSTETSTPGQPSD